MQCSNCGKPLNASQAFCPSCGQAQTASGGKNDTARFAKFRSLLFDPSEEIIAILGNNMAQKFISTGQLSNGFAILTDKRVYFKGKCLIRRGKGFYSKLEEKAVDLSDVTGTGFVHNKALWAKIAMFLCAFLGGLFAFVFLVATNTASPLLGLLLSVSAILIFFFLYKRYNYSAFEISYAGGGIAFDMHWITQGESHEFQRELNVLKDKLKTAAAPAFVPVQMPVPPAPAETNVPQQLVQYKQLLDQGVITQEDFDKKKQQLLGP